MKRETLLDYIDFLKINSRLMLAMGGAIVGLVVLQFYTATAGKECLGIVDAKETSIAFETPVVVRSLFVLPGQQVKKGQPLLEVDPMEINLKVLELQTQIDQLSSERSIRDDLVQLSTNLEKSNHSPLDEQINGLKLQVEALKKLQQQAIRFAEQDGVVGSVNFRSNEQVPPFQPIITINSTRPSVVYGFIHEKRLSDFSIGQKVTIQTQTAVPRYAHGQIVSLGSRIALFPERLQPPMGEKYWGRELVVALEGENQLMSGEKVHIRSMESINLKGIVSEALADSEFDATTNVLMADLPFEASGMVFLPQSKEMLIVSDDQLSADKSPFWSLPAEKPTDTKNLKYTNSDYEFRDLESMSASGGFIYSMSSMSVPKSEAKNSKKIDRLIRFRLIEGEVRVERSVDIKKTLTEALMNIPMLYSLRSELQTDLDIESLAVSNGQGFLALKSPRFDDGSSVVLKISNFEEYVENHGASHLDVKIHAVLRLQDSNCKKMSRISDLLKLENELIILSNCKKQNFSQLWSLADDAKIAQAKLLSSIPIEKLEGISFNHETDTFYLTADHGKNGGSEVFTLKLNKER